MLSKTIFQCFSFICIHRRFAALEKELGSNYTLIQKVNLWEMRLGVFVRSDRLFDVSAVEADTRATGAGRVLGNKGEGM